MTYTGSSPHGRRLADGVHAFGTLREGDWYETPSLAVTAAHIDTFAELTGDRFEIHMTDDAARMHGFSGRVAHGLLVQSLVDGLKNQSTVTFRAIASLGWTWRFTGPVHIGDTISATIRLAGKRTTSGSGRGILFLDFEVRNQDGLIVQAGENQLLVSLD